MVVSKLRVLIVATAVSWSAIVSKFICTENASLNSLPGNTFQFGKENAKKKALIIGKFLSKSCKILAGILQLS